MPNVFILFKNSIFIHNLFAVWFWIFFFHLSCHVRIVLCIQQKRMRKWNHEETASKWLCDSRSAKRVSGRSIAQILQFWQCKERHLKRRQLWRQSSSFSSKICQSKVLTNKCFAVKETSKLRRIRFRLAFFRGCWTDVFRQSFSQIETD